MFRPSPIAHKMNDGPSNETESEVFEFAYADSRYRFLKPDVPQRSFDMICRNGLFYENKILKDMRQRVRGGELVIDVGANIGNHTVFLAGVCNCDVIALEPFQKSFELLIRNIDINKLGKRVTPINVAAGARAGFGDVCLSTTADYGQAVIRETTALAGIRIVPLDELVLPRQPRILKIDVEGSESAVLKGAETLITRARPLIYVETLNEEAFDEVCTFLNRMEYRVLNFFHPATFLFASTGELVLASPNYDPGVQLGRLCLRYCAERYKTDSKLLRLKDTSWRRAKKKIKGSAREIGALLHRRFR
jgi:FkbM family methyltransferase